MEKRDEIFLRTAISVTELNEQIKQLLEDNFKVFWVEGEISNLHRPASGHLYFTLKDERSQLRAVIFRSSFIKMPFSQKGASIFELEEGMSIVCRGRLNVYSPRGEYQLLIDAIEPKGIGALQKAFEQLKARLQTEGLFDISCKKNVPFLPRRIGIITSPTGAVIRDILQISQRRFSSIDIIVAPVRVQGIVAPVEIVEAIANFNALSNVDVIILARGGGSLEDIAPFNDEGVARAIFHSRIPIVSAVGHETDFTIADFVADLRAPTPSAAAELVVPIRSDLIARLENIHATLIYRYRHKIDDFRERLAFMQKRMPSPQKKITDLRMIIGEQLNRIQRIHKQKEMFNRHLLNNSKNRLRLLNPQDLIDEWCIILKKMKIDTFTAFNLIIINMKKRLEADIMILDTISPFAVLRRGYSIVKLVPDGLIVKDTEMLTIKREVEIILAEGGFQAQITEIFGSEHRWLGKNSKKP